MAETTLVSSLFECVTNDFYKIRKKNNKYSKNEFHSRYFRTWFYSMSELFAKKKKKKKKKNPGQSILLSEAEGRLFKFTTMHRNTSNFWSSYI